MLTEERRAQLIMFIRDENVVSVRVLSELLKEYDSLHRTWKDCELEKLRIAALEAHYRQECYYLEQKERYGI